MGNDSRRAGRTHPVRRGAGKLLDANAATELPRFWAVTLQEALRLGDDEAAADLALQADPLSAAMDTADRSRRQHFSIADVQQSVTTNGVYQRWRNARMKRRDALARRLAFPAMSLAASIANAPAAATDDARKPSRKLMRLGLIFAALGLAGALLVALAVR